MAIIVMGLDGAPAAIITPTTANTKNAAHPTAGTARISQMGVRTRKLYHDAVRDPKNKKPLERARICTNSSGDIAGERRR
jgi:hypothetical protein